MARLQCGLACGFEAGYSVHFVRGSNLQSLYTSNAASRQAGDMANLEATLLNHYKIDSLYPAEWPSEKDNEDSSDEEEKLETATSKPPRRSKSRYSVLERNPRQRTSVPGSQKNKDGVENLVQKDEPDPLGGAGSVVQILRARGLPVEEDLKLSTILTMFIQTTN